MESTVIDNQDINFELSTTEKHWLIISDIETKSVIAKESFIPQLGINTRKIYTKSLPKEKLQLETSFLSPFAGFHSTRSNLTKKRQAKAWANGVE